MLKAKFPVEIPQRANEEVAVEPVQSAAGALEDDLADLTPHAFEITCPQTANWFVRRITELRAYRERVQSWASSETRRADRQEEHLFQRFGGQLDRWLRGALVEFHGRRRSINLPAGAVGFRREPARLLVIDEDALLRWCRKNLVEALQIRVDVYGHQAVELEQWASSHAPDARAALSFGKTAINTYFESSGELPEGTNLRPSQDALVVR
jgi:hypothetical protein